MSPGMLEDGRAVVVGEEALELGRPVRVDAEGDVPLDHRAGPPRASCNWSDQLTTLSDRPSILSMAAPAATDRAVHRRSVRPRPARGRPRRRGRSSRWSTGAPCPEEIAARLLDLIRAEQLRPGDKLPAERELAAMMHVSRPVLREALRALVDHERGRDPPGRRHLHHRARAPAAGLAPGLRVLQGPGRAGPGASRRGASWRSATSGWPPCGSREAQLARLEALLAELRGARRRRRPVQHPGHRVPRRRVRGGRQLPPRPVHAHHQHARPRSAASAPAPRERDARARAGATTRRIVAALRARDPDAAATAMARTSTTWRRALADASARGRGTP